MAHVSGKRGFSEKAEAFDVDYLARVLKKSFFGNNIVFKDVIGSTNTFLKELAQKGAPEGMVVIADDQSAGLGRLGRQWYSRKCENLLFSVLLRPDVSARKLFVFTMIFALAAVDAVQEIVSGLDVMIKWPNDIYIGEKKIGGILSEVAVSEGIVQHIILGMGLNVNWRPSGEQYVMYPTSSLFFESGKRISREFVLFKLLKNLEIYYKQVLKGKVETEKFYSRWNQKSLILGKNVVIETGTERIEGKAVEISSEGVLTLNIPGGCNRKFLCGDVSVRILKAHEKSLS